MIQSDTDGLAVSTRGIVRDYGGGAGLHGVDLAVPEHEVYGLIGPNGAGKTTLLSILAGLRAADAGQVVVNVPASRIAVCPDAAEFEPWLTAGEVLGQSMALRGNRPRTKADKSAQDTKMRETLDLVGLAEASNRRTGGFSRGMKQRLGLAAALVLEPELIILDEPASALDPAGRADLLTLVANLAGTRTVIFSSHILADVQRVAHTVGVLDAGRLLFQGSAESLIESCLRPAWNIRIRSGPERLAVRLRDLDWVRAVSLQADGSLVVEAIDADTAERQLPAAVAASGARLISFNPVIADLETAFLTLTAKGKKDGTSTHE